MNEDRDTQAGDEAPHPALAGLRRSQAPGRDLWPGIESRLGARRVRRTRQRLRWAAGLSMAAALMLAVGVSLERGTAPRPLPLHGSATVASGAADPNLVPVVARLRPETRALVKANLKIVNSAESQIRHAIAADPDAEYLKALLADTREHKQELRVVLADAQ
jgi:hypothetical protein